MNDYRLFYALIQRIPKGRVATYGQIARLARMPGHARQVGYALSALPDNHNVPWHRVVNTKGEISPRSYFPSEDKQQTLLKREGVVFDKKARISLSRFQWNKRYDKKEWQILHEEVIHGHHKLPRNRRRRLQGPSERQHAR